MKLRRNLFLTSLIALSMPHVAQAATGTWTGGTGGTWSTAATNWSGVTGTPWDSTNGATNTATFSTASLAATVSGTVFTNGLTISNGGSLTGGTITFAGTTPTVSVATSQTIQIGTDTTDTGIAGSVGLKKTGAGILAIGGSSKAITGGIQVDAGTLRFTTGGGLGSNAITLGATGSGTATVLEWVNNSTNTSSNTVVINNNSGTKTLQVTSGASASISSLTLNGAVSKTNGGTLTLTNAGTYTSGSITVTGGTLQANSAAALPGYNVLGGLVFNGGTLSARVSGSGWTGSEVNSLLTNATKTSGNLGIDTTNGSLTQSTATMTLGSSLGALGLVKNGSNVLVLDQNNTGFTGGVSINAGTLRVAHSTGLGSGTKNINMQGGSRVFELSNGVTLASNYTLRMSSNSFDGGGISSIDGTNAIQGNIEITTGNPALNISSSGTSTLTISGNITNVTDSRPLLFGGNSANDNTVSGVIGESTVDKLMPVTKQGTGTWIFSNSNTYDGGTNINGGTLEIRNANALGTTGTIAFGGGTLKYGTGITTDLSGRFSTAASQAYKINTNGNDVTVGTALNSTGGTLTKEGDGKLTLTTGGSYNGATSVNGGTLVVNGNISTSAVTVASGATLSGIGTVGSTTVNGTFAPGNTIGTLEITGTLGLNNIANFEINPTTGIGFNRSSDLANVSGAISYDGTLNVLYGGLASDFTHGMVFNLFDGSGYFGSFDTLNLPSLTGDLSWQNNLLTDGTLVVIPEPSAALLGGLGLLVLLRRRR